jgi:hypothetical protein
MVNSDGAISSDQSRMPSETAANDGRIDLFGVSSIMLQYNWSRGQGRTLKAELTAENAEAPVIGFLFAFYSISSIFTPSME